jgi:hypothetical protein
MGRNSDPIPIGESCSAFNANSMLPPYLCISNRKFFSAVSIVISNLKSGFLGFRIGMSRVFLTMLRRSAGQMTSEMQPEVPNGVESPKGMLPKPPTTSKVPMLSLLRWIVESSTTSKVEPEVNVPRRTPAVGELKPMLLLLRWIVESSTTSKVEPEVNVPRRTPAVGERKPEVNVPRRTPAVGELELAKRPGWLPTVVMSPVGMLSPERICSKEVKARRDDSPSNSFAWRAPLALASISRTSLRALLSKGGGRPFGAVQCSAPFKNMLMGESAMSNDKVRTMRPRERVRGTFELPRKGGARTFVPAGKVRVPQSSRRNRY